MHQACMHHLALTWFFLAQHEYTYAVLQPGVLFDSIRFDMFNVPGGNWDPTDKQTNQFSEYLRMLSLNERSHTMPFWAT